MRGTGNTRHQWLDQWVGMIGHPVPVSFPGLGQEAVGRSRQIGYAKDGGPELLEILAEQL